MAEQPVVVVRGEATREVPPELAVFTVTVQARDKDRESALGRLTARAAELRTVLDEYAAAIDRRETSSLQIYPEIKQRSEQVVAYTGRFSTTVTVTDFTVLGELLLRLGRQDQAEVSGPWWQLRPGSKAGAEVRRAAIADALGYARDYADAVGARVDRLIEISDTGTDRPMYAMTTMARGGAGADGGLQIDVDPQQQTVQATVVVRVAITEPAALQTD